MTQDPRARICPARPNPKFIPVGDDFPEPNVADRERREERGLMLILAVLLAFAFVGVPILALAAWLVGAKP
jgi:hypothetical protein